MERNFHVEAMDELWVALAKGLRGAAGATVLSHTYVPTATGFLYLAVVLDAFSRRVVGWSMETHLRAELVLQALDMAVKQRRPKGVIHHSNQGSQGEFNRSSQHSGIGGYYDGTQTAVGLVWTEQVAFARSTGLGTA